MRRGVRGIAAAGTLAIFFVSFLSCVSWAADCSEPPFLTSGVQSNALVILDTSGSMSEFAYQEASGSWSTSSTPVTDCGTFSAGAAQCQSTPNCDSYTNNTTCNNCQPCTHAITWTCPPGGDTGTCTLSYKCVWTKISKNNYRCLRATPTYSCECPNCQFTYTVTPHYTAETIDVSVRADNLSYTAFSGYVPTTRYYGYFDPDKTYKYYNTAGKHFFEAVGTVVDPNTTDSTIIRGACLSGGSCDSFSGNWLNWLCMRRIDVAKKVLTGGRLGHDADNYVLIGTPHQFDFAKLFRDNGANGVYYTPFGPSSSTRDMAIYFYTKPDLEQRAGNGDTTKGAFVPLMAFFPASFYSERSATSVGSTTTLGASSTTNAGEPSIVDGTVKRYYDGSYYVAVKHSAVADKTPPSGIVQEMGTKLRVGFMRFNYGPGPAEGYSTSSYASRWDINGDGVYDDIVYYGDGGRILNRVGDVTTVDSWQMESGSPLPILTITKNANEMLASGATPLAEVLREAMNYFRQNSPSYAWRDSSGNLQEDFHAEKGTEYDPYYFKQPGETTGRLQACAKSYIILVSDGEANNDHPCYPETASGDANCPVLPANAKKDFRFNDSFGYLDDIAFKLYTEDNRPDIGNDPGPQTVSVYTIFAFEQGETAKRYMQSTALAGGFSDLNSDGEPGQDYPASCTPCSITGTDPWTTAQRTNCCGWKDSYNYALPWDGWREWDSAKDGKPDHYYEAPDGYLLESQVRSIFAQLALGGAAGAVATISQQTQEGDVIIRGAFDASDPSDRSRYIWNGHLEVYWPDSEGGYEFQYSENQGLFCSQMTDKKGDGLDCWDAAKKLKDLADRGSRNIFTYVDGVKTDFIMANAESFRGLMRQPKKSTDPLISYGVPDVDLGNPFSVKGIIQWTRGVVNASGQPTVDGTTAIGTGYRDRKGYVLGDIVYSTPVIVGPPPLGSVSGADTNLVRTISGTPVDFNDGAEAFWAFRNAWLTQVKSDGTTGTKYQGRPKIAYVGANDGMLHAFLIARLCKATDGSCTNGEWDYNCTAEGGYGACGKELWAYIPSNLLGELFALAQSDYGMTLTSDSCKHRTMVDLSPRAWDVFIKSSDCTNSPPSGCADKRCWRTIIIGGERGGGDVYFAVDVTDPLAPKVLWEYSVLKNLPVVYDDASTLKMNLPFRENDLLHDASITNDSTCDPDDFPYSWPDNCYDQMYFDLKTLPMSWSKAVLGRVRMPSDVKFWRYLQGATGPATLSKDDLTFGDCNNKRHIAFIGTAFQIFNFSDLPSSITNDEIKKALTKPHLLALDVETGQNYFQVLWALAAKARTDAGVSITNDIPLFDQHMPLSTTANYVPWAFGSPALVDVWDNQDHDTAPDSDVTATLDGRFAEDGYVDRMYVGDMQGFLYRMGFNFKDYGIDNTSNPKGLNIEFWKTKPIPATESNLTSCDETNNYRGCRQPISVTPALSYDLSSSSTGYPKIRALFGTGKFDKVTGTSDDKTDETKMSFYNLGDDVAPFCTTVSGKTVCTAVPPIPTGGASYNILTAANAPNPATITPSGTDHKNGFLVGDTHFGLTFGKGACYNDRDATNKYDRLITCAESTMPCDDETKTRVCGDDAACRSACTQITGRDECCNWITDGGAADCCQGTCTKVCDTTITTKCSPCWDCVYDFATKGERVIGDPLIAFGMVFFTTYIPTNTPCAAGGQGYLYILNYRCMPLDSGFNPVSNAFGRTVVQLGQFGAKVALDAGMPSEPVMDSSGQYVFVQKSDATVVKIGVSGGGGGGGGGGSSFKDIQFKGWDKK